MKCFICHFDHFKGPVGLARYKSIRKIGVVDASLRRMSPEPRGVALILQYETDKIRKYFCPECRISVVVQKRSQNVTNTE